MEIAIRNKWITLGGSSVVKTLDGKDLLKVKGKIFTWTRKKIIQDMDGNTLFIVRNKFWRLFVHRAFVMDPNKEVLCTVKKKFWAIRDKLLLENSQMGEIMIDGNMLGYNYHIYKDGVEVGHVSRKISLRDSYVLTINDEENWQFFVALVIALDNITDQRRQEAQNSSWSSD